MQTLTNLSSQLDVFSHFLSPQKQFPPLNDISRKNPGQGPNQLSACSCTHADIAKTTFFVKVVKLHDDILVVKGWDGKICCA